MHNNTAIQNEIKARSLSFFIVGAIGLLAILLACNPAQQKENKEMQEELKPVQQEIVIRTHRAYDSLRNAEAREDSTEMAEALAENAAIENQVVASYETDAVRSELGEDAADDPAIWVNTNNPEQSLIIGTNKRAGLHVYDMKGEELQFVNSGKVNNVDLRDGYTWEGRSQVMVAASNRTTQTVDIHMLDPESRKLSDPLLQIPGEVDDVYGLCMYHQQDANKYFVFVNGKDGRVEQYRIMTIEKELHAGFVNAFQVASQPEGMVADDRTGILYLGVEEDAIYKARITEQGIALEDLQQVKQSTRHDNPNIAYDIEGLALYHGSESTYLVASSQGNFSYAIWKLSNDPARADTYLKSFVVWEMPGSGIDGVEETDGLEIVSTPLGADFPKGLLVVQDGFNYDGDEIRTQNFKLVSWEQLEALLK